MDDAEVGNRVQPRGRVESCELSLAREGQTDKLLSFFLRLSLAVKAPL